MPYKVTVSGVMGVPITFLDHYNPKQFEIVSANDIRAADTVKEKPHGLIKDAEASAGGITRYVRIAVRRRQAGCRTE